MNPKIRCAAPHCKRLFEPDPRVKNQLYCGETDCQRECQREWRQRHPGYYKRCRQDHPAYCQRNTLLQGYRNTKARMIAKMDAFKPAPINDPGVFYLFTLLLIDFYVPRSRADYDKFGYKTFILKLKAILVGDTDRNMTKADCEEFFSNDDNFDLAYAAKNYPSRYDGLLVF